MKSSLLISFCISTVLCSSPVNYIKLRSDSVNLECTVIERNSEGIYKPLDTLDDNAVIVLSKPYQIAAADTKVEVKDNSIVYELYSKSKIAVEAKLNSLCQNKNKALLSNSLPEAQLAEATEVRKIIDNGDPNNRVDVVFMGDGYTASQKEAFFSDMTRLTKEMFEGTTFKSWLPFFNIWAIYVESQESGIGYNGPKNTPFKLYRESGQFRAIYPGNPNYAQQICQLTGVSACDFPAIIANDDYYGGLGGQFIIATKSIKTGTTVLRHEMGHNFNEVGEEYDDGYVYSGVNAAASLNTVSWKSWLTGPLREEKAIYRVLAYPWAKLTSVLQKFTFTSDGAYKRWYLEISITGVPETEGLEIILDGVTLPFKSRGSIDREFYNWSGANGFTKGTHTLTIRNRGVPIDPNVSRMLAMVTMYEYGDESEFMISNEAISAYPTWDSSRRKSYRPSNEKCLMRNMTSPSFCSVCKEGIWLKFLQRVSLIDTLTYNVNEVVLTTLKLGQYREKFTIPGEKITINWYYNDVLVDTFENRDKLVGPAFGKWKVTVKLDSPEIKSDPDNRTYEERYFYI